MHQYNYQEIIIEITRRCNMTCEHCLRGEAQAKDMPQEYIKKMVEHIDYLGHLTISGGEPLLNIDGIRFLMDELEYNHVHIGCIDITTNGLIFNDEVLKLLMDIHAYPYQEEIDQDFPFFQIQVSNDTFHDNEICRLDKYEQFEQNLKKFDFLKCYSRRDRLNPSYLIKEGRAKENGQRDLYSYSEIDIDFDDETVWIETDSLYLNCKGNFIIGCDFSYESQDKNVLCHVDQWDDYIENLADEEREFDKEPEQILA